MMDSPAGHIGDWSEMQTIAQEVCREFLAGGIGDVLTVVRAPLQRVHGSDDIPASNATGLKQRAHPIGVPLGKVVVYRYEMAGMTAPRREHRRQTRSQCLAFPSRHFGQPSVMKRKCTHQLHGIR